jgi:DNA-binding MarR family transcriptional regulator
MQHLPTIDVLRELAVAGVGTSHTERMAILALLESDDPVPTGHLGARIAIGKGSMTSIVNRLVDAKLVRRVHTENRRTIHLEATGTARLAVKRAQKRAGIVEDS